MLTRRLRNLIEWHFYNYNADAAMYAEQAQDIIDAALTANYSGVGGGCGVGNPTESKALKLLEYGGERTWFTVVKNTFNAFRFRDHYPIMQALYIERRSLKDILCDGIWETTFYRWRDEWLEWALKWAQDFRLL